MENKKPKWWRPRINASVREAVKKVADGRTLEAMAERLIRKGLRVEKPASGQE